MAAAFTFRLLCASALFAGPAWAQANQAFKSAPEDFVFPLEAAPLDSQRALRAPAPQSTLAQLHRGLPQDAKGQTHRGLPQHATEQAHSGLPQDATEQAHRDLLQDAGEQSHRGLWLDANAGDDPEIAPFLARAPLASPMANVFAEAPAQAAQQAQAQPQQPNPAVEAIAAEIARWAAAPGADRRREVAEVAAFYAARAGAPIWRDDAGWSPAARAVVAQARQASEDGLDLALYPLPALEGGEAPDIARQEIALSLAAASYARQASGGRIEPRRISAMITAKPEVVEPAAALTALREAGAQAGERLAAFNPPDPGYVALRVKLAEVRASAPAARARIPSGPALKVGMADPRVPLIRDRFGLSPSADAGVDPAIYDTQVAAAVAGFQRENGLPPSGVLTPRTLAALSGGQPNRLEANLIANMEARRWLPRERGADRIDVNIPAYALTVFRNNKPAHRTRVVVGKPDSQTPIFSDRMRFLIVNPYWNVPQSIIENEMAPRLATDPDYFRKRGYEVSERRGKLIVRQPPGEQNALGRIKFMFPNDHAVYLHDTPSRGLFGAQRRAFSHGCVRVDQPFKLAEAVLGGGWSEARVKSLLGPKERTLDLPQPLPIHLSYFTIVVDEKGQLQIYDDIYGHMHRVRQALGL